MFRRRRVLGLGITAVTVDYDSSHQPVAVSFLIEVYNRVVPNPCPTNWAGVRAAMETDDAVQTRLKTDEQARRVAWRIVKDWVEAQMAFIESGQASLAQLFLPHMVKDDGRTFYEEIESNYLLLDSGTE